MGQSLLSGLVLFWPKPFFWEGLGHPSPVSKDDEDGYDLCLSMKISITVLIDTHNLYQRRRSWFTFKVQTKKYSD